MLKGLFRVWYLFRKIRSIVLRFLIQLIVIVAINFKVRQFKSLEISAVPANVEKLYYLRHFIIYIFYLKCLKISV